MFTPTTTTVILSLGALAAAQSISSLSSSCQSVITSLQGNAAGANCTNIAGIINIIATPANTSLVAPINGFLTNFCAAPACTNDTITAVAQNISTGCASDLSSIGVSSSDVSSIASLVEAYFPLGKEIACLADTAKTPQFCVTESLTNIEKYLGKPLSIANLESTLPQLVGQASTDPSAAAATLPANITCTPCVQAAYVLLKNALPGVVNGTDEISAITTQCGATFEQADVTPSGIIEGTGSAVPKPTSAALRSVAAPLSALMAVLLAFATLA